MNFFKKLFGHKHKWKARKINRYQIVTFQLCNCGEFRQIVKRPDSKNIGNNFYWQYSDGSLEPDERCFKHA
jgi:hypothetical protein